MKKQLKLMGLSIDWDREVATCDKAVFVTKLFLKFYKEGLIYKKSLVNRSIENSVLANDK